MSVSVILDHQWSGQVCGLCGNYDRVSENDFIGREGVILETANQFGKCYIWKFHYFIAVFDFWSQVLSQKSIHLSLIWPVLAGNSWQVGSSERCGGVTEILPHPCEGVPERRSWAEFSCDILKKAPFDACHSVVSQTVI